MSDLRIELGEVVRLTLDRPDRRNALSESLLDEMAGALAAIARDRSARVVVIAAEGPVFSSGHDLSEMIGRSPQDYSRIFSRCSRVMQTLRSLPQPVIARVQGHALAAGCQLVAACDLAVAAPEATFGTPGVKIGLFCTTPMVPLVRAVPAKAAMEMLLTGRPISAARAHEIGLINRMADRDRLDEVVAEWTSAIVAASPKVVAIGKAAFHRGLSLDEATAYNLATATMIENAALADAQEGIGAFLQKRPPAWPRG